jgi:ribosomal protein S18 acetylase RimI-like enzyme
VGFISIDQDEEVYEIEHLWILPKYMGKGFGKMLLNDVVAKVVKPGAYIFVESDPNAENFYISQGFKTFSTRESFPKGRFLPLMKKKFISPV